MPHYQPQHLLFHQCNDDNDYDDCSVSSLQSTVTVHHAHGEKQQALPSKRGVSFKKTVQVIPLPGRSHDRRAVLWYTPHELSDLRRDVLREVRQMSTTTTGRQCQQVLQQVHRACCHVRGKGNEWRPENDAAQVAVEQDLFQRLVQVLQRHEEQAKTMPMTMAAATTATLVGLERSVGAAWHADAERRRARQWLVLQDDYQQHGLDNDKLLAQKCARLSQPMRLAAHLLALALAAQHEQQLLQH